MTSPTAQLSPRAQLDLLARVRASTDGEVTTSWWSGDVYAYGVGAPFTHLFGFEGLNHSRLNRIDGGYEMLSREAAFFLDPRTRDILETWENPLSSERVDVIHILNDPVNRKLVTETPYGPFRVSATVLGEDICLNTDIPLAYPSPLPVAEFPDNSADDTYRALELFQFYAPLAEALDESATNVPHTLSWTRVCQWPPFMRMGQRPGGLVFHCRGYKITEYDDVPERTRDYIARTHPEYATAPDTWTEPNETSWTYFRKIARQEAV